MVLERTNKGLGVLRKYRTEFLEMVFYSVLLGLVYIGVSALTVDDLTSDDWLKDVTPIFVGLASVFVAFTVLTISLKENRKQFRLERDLSVRPFIELKSMFLGKEYKESTDLKIYYTGEVTGDGSVGYSDKVPEEYFSKYLVSNSGFGSAYKLRIVGEVGGFFVATPLCIDRVACGQPKNLRFSYVGDIKESDRIFTVCSDIYGNYHIVEHELFVSYNQLVITSNQPLELDSSEKARRIVEVVMRMPVVNDNREFLKKTHNAYAK